MSVWIKVSSGYRNHPKTLRLRNMLGPGAQWFPVALWLYCADSCPSGTVGDDLLEQVVGWTGKPGRLLEALKTVGFLDPDGCVHNWTERSGGDIQKMEARREADRKRKASEDSAKFPAEFQRNSCGGTAEPRKSSSGIPAENLPKRREEKRREEKKREETSLPGQPTVDPQGASGSLGQSDGARFFSGARSSTGLPARYDDTAWRKHVSAEVQQLIDTLRAEVTQKNPETIWRAPEKQEVIAGNRLMAMVRAEKIAMVRLMWLIHAIPRSEFWAGKVFTLATIERNLSQMLAQTSRDFDTFKDDPNPLEFFTWTS